MNCQNDKAWKVVNRFATSSVVIRSRSGASSGKCGIVYWIIRPRQTLQTVCNQETTHVIITQHPIQEASNFNGSRFVSKLLISWGAVKVRLLYLYW